MTQAQQQDWQSIALLILVVLALFFGYLRR